MMSQSLYFLQHDISADGVVSHSWHETIADIFHKYKASHQYVFYDVLPYFASLGTFDHKYHSCKSLIRVNYIDVEVNQSSFGISDDKKHMYSRRCRVYNLHSLSQFC